MTNEQALKILREYQLWRRGIGAYRKDNAAFPYDQSRLGESIDVAIYVLQISTK
jgi:hypothetical protein